MTTVARVLPVKQAFRRSLRFDRSHPEDWVAWSLRGFLALTVLGAWFVPGWDVFLKLSMAGLSLLGLAVALGIGAIPSDGPRFLRGAEALASSLFVLNTIGHLFDLYGGTSWFDVALHGWGGVIAALGAYWLARATHLFWPEGGATPFRAFWVALSAALVMGALFEIAEFTTDLVLGTETQDTPDQTPHTDTMTDILAETGTGLLVALGVAAWTRRRKGGRTVAPPTGRPADA